MSASLARYLKDFSEPQTLDASGAAHDLSDEADVFALPEPEMPDPEAIRQEAYAEGHDAATRELQARFAEEREALEAAHRQEMEALSAAHDARSAEIIVAKINEMAAVLAESLSQQTVAILAPILSDAVADKAVADLSELARAAIGDGEVATIQVRGPADLFEVLKAKMGSDADLLRHVESPDLDLTVEIHGSVLVTRISAWAASLKKVLE